MKNILYCLAFGAAVGLIAGVCEYSVPYVWLIVIVATLCMVFGIWYGYQLRKSDEFDEQNNSDEVENE